MDAKTCLSVALPAQNECPLLEFGIPIIRTTEGDRLDLSATNEHLSENACLHCDGNYECGIVAPGGVAAENSESDKMMGQQKRKPPAEATVGLTVLEKKTDCKNQLVTAVENRKCCSNGSN